MGENYRKGVELLKEGGLSGNRVGEFSLGKGYLGGKGVEYKGGVGVEVLGDGENRGMKEGGNVGDNLEGR